MKNVDVATLFGGSLFRGGIVPPKAIQFTPSTTVVPGLRFDYLVERDKVKFHVWATKEWPDGIGDVLRTVLSLDGALEVQAEFTPEVNSWYVAVSGLHVVPTPDLVESLILKVAHALT